MTYHYDKYPQIDFKELGSATSGIGPILDELASLGRRKLAIELYMGVDINEVKAMFAPLGFETIIDVEQLKKNNDSLKEEFKDFITDDRVFGYMCTRSLKSCFDNEKLEAARKLASEAQSVLVIGTGASLVTEDATIIYFDMSRWEIQLRYRNGLSNWLVEDSDAPNLMKFKIGYFIEWRMADKLKMSIFDKIDYFVDTHTPKKPLMVKGDFIREALKALCSRPFRMEPYFDPGVWGGQWMKEKFQLPKGPKNYAWSFDGVPEENCINLLFEGGSIKLPAINLVLYQSERLLGPRVFGRYGAQFPIRFDLLDTMGGGNLSLQVHPLTSYIQDTFGMHYTQDESYYILDAKEGASVYLGVKKDVDRAKMVEELRKAEGGEILFDAEKYVNRILAKKHDHFLIPGGTIHCSGAGSMVLEISTTPYIFTFKLWDWGRVGLDGVPRPVHISHGEKNIQFQRDTDFVMKNLVNNTCILEETNTIKVELTGLDEREPIVTRRYTIQESYTVKMDGSVQMLNLVEGRTCIIESPTGAFKPFEVHYAETFIIPADVGTYTIKAVDEPIMLIEARIRG